MMAEGGADCDGNKRDCIGVRGLPSSFNGAKKGDEGELASSLEEGDIDCCACRGGLVGEESGAWKLGELGTRTR